MKTQNNLVVRYVFIALSVAIMIFIFCMSAQNAGESDNTSGQVIKTIAQIIKSDFKELPVEQQDEYVASFQFTIRKLAHFSIYTALGFCICSAFATYESIRLLYKGIFSVFLSGVYAASDEFHQSFVPGRSCELRDMSIDTAGALLGTLISILFFYLARRFTESVKKRKK